MTGPNEPSTTPPPPRHFVLDGVRWEATEAGEQVLRAQWAKLSGEIAAGRLAPIKSNPLRRVYRVAGDGEIGECFLKRYDESSLKSRIKRLLRGPTARLEWRNTRYADAAGLAVPTPLAFGVGDSVSYLLTASCLPAENLDEHLDATGWGEPVAQSLARLLASAHAAGILHRDLHAGNVLCRPAPEPHEPPRLWLLDLHKALVGVKPSDAAAVRNLASIVAGLRNWADADQLASFLRAYLEFAPAGSGLAQPASFIAAVERQADLHAAALLRSRDRAILRTSRYFTTIRPAASWCGHVFLQARRRFRQSGSPAMRLTLSLREWQEALADPRALARPADGEEPVKRSASSSVVRRILRVGDAEIAVYIKRVPWRWRLAALVDPLRRSRAVRAFKRGHQLLARGVPTAVPLACLERRVGRWLVESILITEAVTESVHLERFVVEKLPALPASLNVRVRQSLARRLGEAIARMHRAGWVHRDMKAPNVLVQTGSGGQVRIAFVDLDGLTRWGRDEFRPLARLNDGLWSAAGLTLSDRWRALRSYLGPEADCKRAWRTIQQMTAARRGRRQRP